VIDRSIPNVPEIRADMMAYFAVLGAMCDRMLPPFAAALGLCGDFFAPFFADEAHAVVRFLHYPPQETTEDNTFGQAPHTDNSFMTALARTDVPGLAVRLPSGEWFAPRSSPRRFWSISAISCDGGRTIVFCRRRTASSTNRGQTAIRSPTFTAPIRMR
jgi:isopenicillin N synthase-like dioxygenase